MLFKQTCHMKETARTPMVQAYHSGYSFTSRSVFLLYAPSSGARLNMTSAAEFYLFFFGRKRRGELPLISLKNKCSFIFRYGRFIFRSIHTPVS